MTVNLSPQTEARLTAAAQQRGIDIAALIEKLATDYLPPAQAPESPVIDEENAAAIAQLKAWMREDATDNPEVIREAEEDLAEFKRNMNANRALTGDHTVYH